MSPLDKARAINQAGTHYGSFAEIGAGQEVARWFFAAGKASNTVAKTMSAYDMTFSDAIYGAEEHNRYVCENRLRSMLATEYKLLEDRIGSTKKSRFFVFADTVASLSSRNKHSGHGWLGIRFQSMQGSPTSDCIVHFRMQKGLLSDQQAAIGILGVNLLHACLMHDDMPAAQRVKNLLDDVRPGQITIDTMRFDGPLFASCDRLELARAVLEHCCGSALLMDPQGRLLPPADTFFHCPLLAATEAVPDNVFQTAQKTLSHSMVARILLKPMLLKPLLTPSILTDASDVWALSEFFEKNISEMCLLVTPAEFEAAKLTDLSQFLSNNVHLVLTSPVTPGTSAHYLVQYLEAEKKLSLLTP